jgi:DNA polymerase-3 subunit gamma/tau
MPSSVIVSHLQSILQQESIEADEKALRIIAKSARGSMRDALSLTDQAIAYTSGKINEELVRNMLGSLDDAYLIRILVALANQHGQELMDISNEMALHEHVFCHRFTGFSGSFAKNCNGTTNP